MFESLHVIRNINYTFYTGVCPRGDESPPLVLMPSDKVKTSPPVEAPLLSPADKVERDLHRCTQIYFQTPNPRTPAYAALAGYFKLLEEFLPPGLSYLSHYTNPCWYSDLHIQNSIPSGQLLTEFVHLGVFRENILLKYGNTLGDDSNPLNLTHRGDKRLYCLPKFYLAGFPKTGTTSLYEYITQHEDVAKPVDKEGHFWRVFAQDKHESRAAKRLQILWYLKHFSYAAEHIEKFPAAVTIDASVSTIWTTANHKLSRDEDICLIPSLVSSVYPQTRFIVLMRDPVERLFSGFWYNCGGMKRKCDLHHAPALFHNLTLAALSDFNQCINEGVSEFECARQSKIHHRSNDPCYDFRLGMGLYYYHIAKWLNVFPMEQFLFVTSEEMSRNLTATMRKIWDFMGLKSIDQTKQTLISKHKNVNWVHSGHYEDKVYMLPESATLLREFYKPFNERLALLLKDAKYNDIWNPKKHQ